MRVVGLLLLAGCGRISFDQLASAADDAVARTCWSAWTDGPLMLSAPQPIVMLNTAAAERDPSLAGNDLHLYYATGPAANPDIFTSTRAETHAPWQSAAALALLSTAVSDS